MKPFDTSKIKNIALLGHAGSGKTTLAECMLFEAGEIKRIGKVSDNNTVSDYHNLEHSRGNSLFSTPLHLTWKDTKINIVDTPGYDDFIGEVISTLKVANTGVMVLNGQNGVEVGTEIIWEYVEQFKTPMVFVVNHMDSDKSNFEETVEQAKERFGSKLTVVQYPLNQGVGFNAIIDVLKMTMYKFPDGGGKPQKLPIPASEKDKADELHNELVEAVAAFDEDLMEVYFEEEMLTEEQMASGLKAAMIAQEICPVFCTSADRNMGSGRVLGFIRDIAPTAADVAPVSRTSGATLHCDPKANVCLFVYKTISEPHLGEITCFKVYAGTVRAGMDLVNSISGAGERLNQLYVLNGRKRQTVDKLSAGDLGATVKLKATATNSSLHEKNVPINIIPIKFPLPRIRVAVAADNKANMEKLAMALNKIRQEDPTILVEQSKELNQMLVYGQGELHLAMAKWKIENNHRVNFEYIKPRIAFRETIRKSVKTSYRHKKQTGGAGQFGEVHMLVEPYKENMPLPADLTVRRAPETVNLEWGGKLVFYNAIIGGAIDAKYMNAIIKGIMEKMVDGPLTGSYVRDVRVFVYDGKMHAVDSNDMAFKLAATQAFKQAFEQANPQVLEPIYDVEVLVAGEMMGDVMSDLQTRRAIIMGMETVGHYQKIKARVPLLELYKYSSALRSLSQGRAKHTQKFAEYAAVSSEIQQRLITEHKMTVVGA